MKRMPFESKIVHVRWSGEGVWIPLGDHDFGVDFENNTSFPAPGQMILYPGGISETEILLEGSFTTFFDGVIADITGLMLMLLVLVVKPTGLFGAKDRV